MEQCTICGKWLSSSKKPDLKCAKCSSKYTYCCVKCKDEFTTTMSPKAYRQATGKFVNCCEEPMQLVT